MIARPADRNRSTRHPGLASVAVLIALIVIAIVAAGLLKVAFARRGQVAMEERRLQADWLAGSGLERALARLSASSDYAGEDWEIPAEDLGGRGPAKVTIRVDRVADRPDRRAVRVTADYPGDSPTRSRQGREMVVPVQSSSR